MPAAKGTTTSSKPSKASKVKVEDLDEELETDLEGEEELDLGADSSLDEEPRDEERSKKEDVDNDADLDLDTPVAGPRSDVEGDDKFADLRPEHLGLRNFRSHPDFENLYRFINEYGLRREAFMTIDKILSVVAPKKRKSSKSGKKARKH